MAIPSRRSLNGEELNGRRSRIGDAVLSCIMSSDTLPYYLRVRRKKKAQAAQLGKVFMGTGIYLGNPTLSTQDPMAFQRLWVMPVIEGRC